MPADLINRSTLMQKRFLILFLTGFVITLVSLAAAQNTTLLFSGRWGKEVNQLGIRFPAPGVMPVAPYECVGGFDATEDGSIWFADSVNGMLKCYSNKNWSYIMLNFGKLGELAWAGKKIYVVTRNPDGIAVVSPEKGKVERHIRIDFKSPGRLKVINDKLILIEEQGTGLLVCRNDKAELHPAGSLEAASAENRIYGVQYNFETESRTIIGAEISEEVQEPETIGLFEAGETIIFSKLAGVIGNRPVLMVITKSSPDTVSFLKLGDNAAVEKKVTLPVLDAPFLTTSWKLCSDGQLYGFSGTASEGFRLFRAENSL